MGPVSARIPRFTSKLRFVSWNRRSHKRVGYLRSEREFDDFVAEQLTSLNKAMKEAGGMEFTSPGDRRGSAEGRGDCSEGAPLLHVMMTRNHGLRSV